MDDRTDTRLRVLAADEDREALDQTARLLGDLGHEVTACAVSIGEAAAQIAADDPDLAVVVLHDDEQHALDLIDEISEYASGPVIALMDRDDPEFVTAAAERGLDAVARPESGDAVQSAIELALRRHAERRQLAEQVDQLESALERRATIERAKGILMERHGIGEREAFERLRSHARSHNQTVVSVANAVSEGHELLRRDAG
ncbi:ANTAR domain-containing response regulator [Capillimicrobium parvum]|uniref:Transcriptional regulatory protein pdtaR n=1 Tax=Capillimicrobium parvum TaxID=2884022 RepID=A0A9E6Y1B4_9ACTN|nr:ANTAR domain-containing protein [Capillimicrobium parvum]UGS37838.1 putative transcriptional regulatory protein pdtaR [Capillimicrobium parvum]